MSRTPSGVRVVGKVGRVTKLYRRHKPHERRVASASVDVTPKPKPHSVKGQRSTAAVPSRQILFKFRLPRPLACFTAGVPAGSPPQAGEACSGPSLNCVGGNRVQSFAHRVPLPAKARSSRRPSPGLGWRLSFVGFVATRRFSARIRSPPGVRAPCASGDVRLEAATDALRRSDLSAAQ